MNYNLSPRMTEQAIDSSPRATHLFWRYLTPTGCRLIFAALMLLGALIHIRYLNHNCPLGLSEDEAHYWDWSRQLGLSYYSKGPLIAYIIRASCSIFGDTMPAVRYPATILSIATATLTYWLIVKLFHSDRLALGWTVMSHMVPLFVAGSLLMTIDSPFFFCWAAATCMAAKGIFDRQKKIWPWVGVAIGVGFLAKYTMFLWPACLIPLAIVDSEFRAMLRSGWFWSMFPIALVFTTPVVVFNAQHNWITVFHVHADTAAGFAWKNLPLFLAGQAGVLGPFICMAMIGAVVYVVREGRVDANRRELNFLAGIGVTFFAIVTSTAFTTNLQPNWPACAYFTLMILTAYFLSRRLWTGPHKWCWRANLICAAIFAAIFVPIAHNFEILYPFLSRELPTINRVLTEDFHLKHPKTLGNIDPTYKLRGWPALGAVVANYLQKDPDARVIGEDYQTASELGFYTPGHPKTFAAGSYFATHTKRLSQFDLWADRSLEPSNPAVVGHNAIYVGDMNPTLQHAFDSVDRLPDVEIRVNGYLLRTFTLWHGNNFHGMRRPSYEEF